MIANYYSEQQVFISYSHADEKFANRLRYDLQNQGVGVWLDSRKIKVGDSITQQVLDGIFKSDFICLVVSKNSIQSNWVIRECLAACIKQIFFEGKPRIFPLLIDNTPPPILFNDTKCTDFSKEYEDGFQPLIEAIKDSSFYQKSDMPKISLFIKKFLKQLMAKMGNLASPELCYELQPLIEAIRDSFVNQESDILKTPFVVNISTHDETPSVLFRHIEDPTRVEKPLEKLMTKIGNLPAPELWHGLQPLIEVIKANPVNQESDMSKTPFAAHVATHDAPLDVLYKQQKESSWLDILFQSQLSLKPLLTRIGNLPEPKLRTGTLKVLCILQSVFKDIGVAGTALSPFKRSKIVKNTKTVLNQLRVEGEEICPNPEWSIIKEIALKWLEIIDKFGWEFPREELKQPVENPYDGSSGLPVTSTTFKGREGIIKRIEEHWATDKNFSTLILYGPRRIGKTSILYNMIRRTEGDILLVYISMQKVGRVNHTGQLLYRFAEAISRTAGAGGLPAGTSPDEADYTDMEGGSQSLNRLLDKLAPHITGQKRMVLAIDEFEFIQEKIEDKQIDAGILPYLRDMVQQYSWMGMIFAGLHIIEEMGRDYKAAFFGQAQYIKVSFLKKEDAFELITHPKPPWIALEYSDDLLEELYRLTAGQPYLIQCLCGELVYRWNERFDQEGEETSRTLSLDHLPQVFTSDFFESTAFYFDGIWFNVTENERSLMSIIAEHQKGTCTLDKLINSVKNHPALEKFSTLKETIELLKRHDVILEEGGNVSFAGELMRRWVAEKNNRAH